MGLEFEVGSKRMESGVRLNSEAGGKNTRRVGDLVGRLNVDNRLTNDPTRGWKTDNKVLYNHITNYSNVALYTSEASRNVHIHRYI